MTKKHRALFKPHTRIPEPFQWSLLAIENNLRPLRKVPTP